MAGPPKEDVPAELLALLPKDLQAVIKSLPREQALDMLAKLIQQTELTYRTLTPADVALIKARTDKQSQFGFLPVDVGFTWDDIAQENFIALGAFDVQPESEQEVPVAFIIAEVSRIDHTLSYLDKEVPATASTSSSPWKEVAGNESGPVSPAADPSTAASVPATSEQAGPGSVQELVEAEGWQDDDLAVSVQYIGVDFEYRRQGIGKQLLDMVKEVAWQAGARFLWLTVADYNTQAVAFYKSYGFTQTCQYRRGERGNHLLCVLPNPDAGTVRKVRVGLRAAGKKQKKGTSGRRKPGANKGFGSSPKACCLQQHHHPRCTVGHSAQHTVIRNASCGPSSGRRLMRQSSSVVCGCTSALRLIPGAKPGWLRLS